MIEKAHGPEAEQVALGGYALRENRVATLASLAGILRRDLDGKTCAEDPESRDALEAELAGALADLAAELDLAAACAVRVVLDLPSGKRAEFVQGLERKLPGHLAAQAARACYEQMERETTDRDSSPGAVPARAGSETA